LPPGISVNDDGRTLSGTPTTAGTYPVTVSASDSTCSESDATFTIQVADIAEQCIADADCACAVSNVASAGTTCTASTDCPSDHPTCAKLMTGVKTCCGNASSQPEACQGPIVSTMQTSTEGKSYVVCGDQAIVCNERHHCVRNDVDAGP
jgi:hypothetical protein